MILCLDCGNTSIKFALVENGYIIKSYLIRTNRERSSDEYAYSLSSIVGKDVKLEGAIISSVVPLLTPILHRAIELVFNVDALILGKKIKTKLPLKIDNPNELGADMLSGALAAKSKYGECSLVADLGTATKIYIVDKNGAFIGGAITSGMEISLKTLLSSTSQLLETPIIVPNRVIGRNTKDCIESGIVYGQAFMIREFANEMENECGYRLRRILTGGFSKIIKNVLNEFTYDENLILDGLYEIYKMNEESSNV